MTRAREIREFWLDEAGPQGWYLGGDDLDAEITKRFEADWEKARRGEYDGWQCRPEEAFSLIVLLDQFPRNMFRGTAKAFSSDKKALCCAKKAIDRGFDLRLPEPERQFFYLPMMHSESLTDQERCVRLMTSRMAGAGESNLLHAKVHREVIRRFGRFPYRNEALARGMTGPEISFIEQGGYEETLRQLQN